MSMSTTTLTDKTISALNKLQKIVQQVRSKSSQTNVQQVYSNWRTKSSSTEYNEVMKMNWLIEQMIKRQNEL